MTHTTLTRTVIVAAASLGFVASLTAQTIAQEQPLVASLDRPALISGIPAAYRNTLAVESTPTPVAAVKDETAQPKQLVSASLMNSAALASATSVKWTAPQTADRSSSHKSWVRVEPGTMPNVVSIYPGAPPNKEFGAAPAVVNVTFGK
jgi:hypothetical protein